MLHLAGFFEDVDQANILQAINAMADQSLNTSGDDLTVPVDLAFLAGTALLTAATTFTSAQIRAPSLQTLGYQDIARVVPADNFANPVAVNYYADNPRPLAGNEDLQFFTDTDHAAAIEIQGFVWLSDGPVTPVKGEQFTVRATSASTLVQGTWVNSNLTFTQTLPVGRYQIVGMRAQGANLQAARLSFVGGGYRPGVPGVTSTGDEGFTALRNGNSGVLGEFSSTALPSVDCVGITDTAQTIFLDLVKVG